MKLSIDTYAYLNSPIHRWQQEYKIIGLLSLIFAFSFINNLILLPIILLIASVIYLISRLPFNYLISRLRYPGWFILGLVIFLPFLVGDKVIFQWGWLSLKQEGCQQAILIVVRFFCILTVSLVLFGTAPFIKSIKSLKNLGVPWIIVDMMLLTYRYLEELGQMLNTMQRAIKLRGFEYQNFKYRKIKILARLIGSLFVRSYERSNRIYNAMVLRGYGYTAPNKINNKKLPQQISNYKDLYGTISALIIAISLLGLEIFLS